MRRLLALGSFVMARRPGEAWQEKRTDWRPELLYGGAGGGVSVSIMILAGWPSGVASFLIPTFAALAAVALVPVAHFLWLLLLQPWRDLQADVAGVRARLDTEANVSLIKRKVNPRLSVVNAIRKGKTIRDSPTRHSHWNKSVETWIDEVARLLAEHVSGDAAERFIAATDNQEIREKIDARLEVLEGLLEEGQLAHAA